MMPDGGRESARRFEDLGDVFLVLGLVVEFQLHHLAQFLGLGAVHRQHQRLFQEGIFDVLEFASRAKRCLPCAPCCA